MLSCVLFLIYFFESGAFGVGLGSDFFLCCFRLLVDVQAGRVASLDSLASQFFTALPSSRAELYDEAVVLGKDLGVGAAYYLKVMEKLVNGTENYVEKEAKRYVPSFPFLTYLLSAQD